MYNTTPLYTSSMSIFSINGILIVIPTLSLLSGTFKLFTIQ
jgi:uncharacterized membrane protein